MTNKEKDASRLETVLAFSFIASVAVSVLAVLIILLAAFSNNAWIPTGLGLVPMLALPFGMLCLIAVLVLSARRKKKEQAK